MKLDQDDLDAIAAYTAAKGNVTVCPPGERTDPELIGHVWTRGKPGRPPANAPVQTPEEE